jgi:hypothetical protein
MFDWLIVDYDGMRLCLRTAATNGRILYPLGDMWALRAVVMLMLAGVTSGSYTRPLWQSYHTKFLGQVGETYEGVRILLIQCLRYLKRSLTCRKILQQGTSVFTSHPKEGVLQIFIALKIPSLWPGFKPRPLGPVTITLTTTLPRRLCIPVIKCY